MKVILLERVGRMGQIGDEVTVKDGFARNFLLPQAKALRATEANRKRFEKERADIEKRNTERREAAAGIAAGLNGRTVVIIRQAGEIIVRGQSRLVLNVRLACDWADQFL